MYVDLGKSPEPDCVRNSVLNRKMKKQRKEGWRRELGGEERERKIREREGGLKKKDKIKFSWAHFVNLYSTRMSSETLEVTELVWI